jgi:hypothetical protein
VGDGKDIYLWVEAWHLNGILVDKYGPRVVFEDRSKIDARLSSVIHEMEWH